MLSHTFCVVEMLQFNNNLQLNKERDSIVIGNLRGSEAINVGYPKINN